MSTTNDDVDKHDGNPKSSQLKFIRPAHLTMFANVVCDPPLGQTTVIPFQQRSVIFTVLIESSKSFSQPAWEVALWHDCTEAEWEELHMSEVPLNTSPLSVNSAGLPAVHRQYYTAELFSTGRRQKVYDFTVKFRLKSTDKWVWVNDQFSKTNGEICRQPAVLPEPPKGSYRGNEDLAFYLDLPSYFRPTARAVASETPDTKLWTISAQVYKSDDFPLGIPLDCNRWFSLIRIWTPWLAPRHGEKEFSIAEDAILCSFLRWDGLHFVLLAVSGINDVMTVLKSNSKKQVVMSSKSDGDSRSDATVIAAVGRSFESAVAAAMYKARKMVTGTAEMSVESAAKDIKPDWLENWYDGLTYCTWNGLGQDLTEQKIYNALDELEKNDIVVTNLIIDDNWQSLDNPGESQFKRGWTEFEANKEGFPLGLNHTVSQIRSKHPKIQHIAVWHAMFGYWGGISPDGKIAKSYKTRQVHKQDGVAGGTFTVVDADDAAQMYDDFYKFLSSAGVDAVKTDAQFFLDLLDDPKDRKRFITAYQDAWTISSLRHFSENAISCMSQTPQILFYSQLPTNKPRLMVRNSDDFFPEVPASHPWHIFTNAHNSLFTQHLNVLPDWDMFQTSHPYSSFHAAGRCVSGGPIYITDEPGKHDIDLIHQMTAINPRGKRVILRPSTIGKSVHVYNSYETERLLKVGTFNGWKGTGTGILGIFNVSQRPLSELVPLRDVPSIERDGAYIIRAHSTGEISDVMALGDNLALVSLDVVVKGWEILSAYPLQSFTLSGSRGTHDNLTKVAVLGLLGKMTGAAAVMNSDIYIESNGRLRIQTSLKALGVLGVFISDLATRSIEDDFMITILGKAIPLHTVKSSGMGRLLELDIESAWKEMDLDSGWSNEVTLNDQSLFKQECYVNGEWIKAKSGKTFEVTDPSSGKVIGSCPEFNKEDTENAIKVAEAAFVDFRKTLGRERSRMLRKWYQLMVDNAEDLAKLITWENGKPLADAKGEVTYAANFFEWFSEEAPRTYGDTIPASIPGNRVFTIKEPVGVCGLITPWNFPAAMITRKIGPALAAGCTVVAKSPGETPFTSLAIAELAHRAGIPKGVVNFITAMENTAEVGETLTSSQTVRKVSFTGSTGVGKLLMKQSADTLKKLSFELGGNAPFIVFDDADLDAAVTGAITSKFRSSGQTCVCANRIYVQKGIYDEFAKKFTEKVKGFKVGGGYDQGITHGPLIHDRAVGKVEAHVKDAESKGAKVVQGGHKMPKLGSNFFEPTVITGMTMDMKIASEETFGPVAALFPFDSEKDVVEMANKADVGLAGYFFSRDLQRVYRVAEALETGMVGVNTGLISDPAAPFGGVKYSGFGREGSKYGIEEYQITKMITLGGMGQPLGGS